MRFLLVALMLGTPAAAQTTGERLLSGTTFGLPWGIYAGGLTNLFDGETRLRLSAPQGARVLGTRYDPGTRTALVVYRHAQDARAALAFAVGQLQRQGFEPTFRAFPDPGVARALLRRNELLMEVRVTRGAQGVTHTLYQFRGGELPERLLVDQVPDDVMVYAAPVDLRTVQVEPGRVILTPPADVLIDDASYRSGIASLRFYGNFTLEQMKAFYLPFFKAQGFVETGTASEGPSEITYRFGRGAERLTVELEVNTTDEASVELRYQP